MEDVEGDEGNWDVLLLLNLLLGVPSSDFYHQPLRERKLQEEDTEKTKELVSNILGLYVIFMTSRWSKMKYNIRPHEGNSFQVKQAQYSYIQFNEAHNDVIVFLWMVETTSETIKKTPKKPPNISNHK